jgi:sugar O-acyltransferase (sialic acid O-acetyltransferase NeuD family)
VSAGRQPLVLLAASGLAREVMAGAAVAEGFDLVGVLDDDRSRVGATFGSSAVVGGIDDAVGFPDARFVVCAGGGLVRRRIVSRLAALGIGAARYATVIDPSAVVPDGCTVGPGSILLSHVSLTAAVSVGRHVVIMPQAVLTHDNRIDDYATICAGVALGGQVRIGSAAYLGMNSSVRPHLRVGDNATLGMGSVLLQDLPDDRTWAGNPARDLGDRAPASNGHQQEFEPVPPVGGSKGAVLS